MGEQTDKHTQGRGHSIFPPPPIWCHVLGSDVFAPPRGQREQGGVVPSHSNRLAEEHCRRIKQTRFRCLDRYQRLTWRSPLVPAAEDTDLALIKAAKRAAS